MNDEQIVQLYFDRSERAIEESQSKYGNYCYSIAFGVLKNAQDSEETVSDTWLRAWNAIPPQRPRILSAFFGKITRNLSLDRWRSSRAQKRGGDDAGLELVLDELAEIVPAPDSVERSIEGRELTEILNRFLGDQPEERRKIFLQRYWYMLSVKEIADGLGISESKVKMQLLRGRERLRELLEQEGYGL